LRKKLTDAIDDDHLIQTIWGRGYEFASVEVGHFAVGEAPTVV
jgi:DNA-binding winged helix-turn-helix (wHTH) protein